MVILGPIKCTSMSSNVKPDGRAVQETLSGCGPFDFVEDFLVKIVLSGANTGSIELKSPYLDYFISILSIQWIINFTVKCHRLGIEKYIKWL